jgi:hypothetical protein
LQARVRATAELGGMSWRVRFHAMTFRMSSGAFTGSKIPHLLRHERHPISMTGDNLTALNLGPQAWRNEQARDLPDLGIPKMEANRHSAQIKAGAGHRHHGCDFYSKGQPGHRPRDTPGGDSLRSPSLAVSEWGEQRPQSPAHLRSPMGVSP